VERFKQLQYFFQAIKQVPEDLIQDVITRDFNQISLYAKACAIYSLLNLKDHNAGQELVASIFHPNQLIRESAAYVMEKKDPEKLESVLQRLEPTIVNEIRSSLPTPIRKSLVYCFNVSGLLKNARECIRSRRMFCLKSPGLWKFSS
jgi:hypothetical protein